MLCEDLTYNDFQVKLIGPRYFQTMLGKNAHVFSDSASLGRLLNC